LIVQEEKKNNIYDIFEKWKMGGIKKYECGD